MSDVSNGRSIASALPDWLSDVLARVDSQPTRKIPDIRAQWVWMTVKRAEALLELNTNNRNLRQTRVDRYRDMMLSGEWDERTPQFIVLDVDREIADGQHRLWAVVESGQPCWMLVIWDVPKISRLNIDQNGVRSVADNLGFAGVLGRLPSGFDGRALTATCNAMRQGPHWVKSNMPAPELVAWCEEHHKAIQWVIDGFNRHKRERHLSIAPIYGLFARAFYYAAERNQLPRLREAIDVLLTGVVLSEEDCAIVPFRDWVLKTRGRNSNANVEIFQRGLGALLAFLNREPRVLSRPSKGSEFALPSDPSPEKARRADRVVEQHGDDRPGRRGTDLLAAV